MRSWVSWSAGVAHYGVACPEDAVPVLTLACPARLALAGWPVVCLQGVVSIAAWSSSGGALSRMVGWFAVGPVVPLPASAWSLWWFVVQVVRLCVVGGRAVGGWLCGSHPAVGVLVEGPATSQPVVAHAAVLAGPGCGGGFLVALRGPCRSSGCRQPWSGLLR